MATIMGITDNGPRNLLQSRCVLSLFLISSVTAYGAQWTITPSVTAKDTYSDNINLSNNNKQSDQVLEIVPAIRIQGEGRRLRLNFDYNAQGLHYFENTNDDEVNHRLQSGLSSELIEDHLFLNATANITQQLIDERRGGSNDNISGSDNLSDVFTYEINPYWQQKLGSETETVLGVRYNEVNYSGNNGSGTDSSGQSLYWSVNSAPGVGPVFWRFDYNYDEVDYESQNDTERQSESILVGYQWTPKFNTSLTVGYESQDNDIDNIRNDTDGAFWLAGMEWALSRKTSLSAQYGKRYYGDTYGFNLSHQRKRSVFTLSYSEQQQTIRDQILIGNFWVCPEGVLIGPGCGQEQLRVGDNPESGKEIVLQLPGGTTSQVDDYFISKDTNLGWYHVRKRDSFNVNAYRQEREFQTRNNNELVHGINVGWNRRLSRKVTSNVNLGWSTNDFEDNSDSNTWTATFQLQRQLSRDMSGALEFATQKRTSDIETNEYTENRISVSIRKTF
ncbi:TIGR03016 family PEP-CTERM system-associated outer membrane protein [Endozoicomonas sp. SM1973]|uniref:TIGR03016 family PEP-CTERM system-associated outer membrane protein n=1 Tax=Spartinivicinus marinus TaxID=2994442 RepID=A0A853IC82_9GAMM|nr:TIGR03016 family PEP-CTERM system-associated outer membrane protein [Spartinivicinus marinus]MCX4024992.1 TIGR03016 family PEP-CTERM system-associated outer membrane protein [Spartinivicinus marinus]NYZ67684.1 TIGR03016 family PEP-CTERM system-associated outer membrane protein [Spartinivicinus marinus]